MPFEVTVAELQLYARCSLAWWWKKRLGWEKPTTLHELAPAALRQALTFYAQGHTLNLEEATGWVWRDWCESWGAAEAWADLRRYAAGRAEILTARTSVHSKAYRQQMQAAGLTQLAGRLNTLANAHGFLAPEANNQTSLADVCADSLLWAGRMQTKLPTPREILGGPVPHQIKLGDGLTVHGQADWLTCGDTTDSIVIEIHDFSGHAPARAGDVTRDLRVLAATLAEPVAGEGPHWATVQGVVYRHWPSGQTFTVRELNVGYFHSVVTALTRGMASEVIVPRSLTNSSDCAACDFYAECFDAPAWHSLPLLDATLHTRANRVREVMRGLRSAIGADNEAARRTQKALEHLQAALVEQSDVLTAQAVLAEAQHFVQSHLPPSQ